jgi:hypothetical protein
MKKKYYCRIPSGTIKADLFYRLPKKGLSCYSG